MSSLLRIDEHWSMESDKWDFQRKEQQRRREYHFSIKFNWSNLVSFQCRPIDRWFERFNLNPSEFDFQYFSGRDLVIQFRREALILFKLIFLPKVSSSLDIIHVITHWKSHENNCNSCSSYSQFVVLFIWWESFFFSNRINRTWSVWMYNHRWNTPNSQRRNRCLQSNRIAIMNTSFLTEWDEKNMKDGWRQFPVNSIKNKIFFQ